MEVYLVGGAVRDKLLGIESVDHDYVVVGSTIEEMLSKGFAQVGNDFPVFLHPETKEEYALARTERKRGHGYTGFICDFSQDTTLEEDLIRRDLTINAMAQDEVGNIIDPYGGQADLQNRVLRHVSPAFVEDPLRVLRVARFAAKLHYLGFTIAPETLELMREISESGELQSLTQERIWVELQKALETTDPEVFIEVLHHVNALKEILPEVEALSGVPGPKRWHPEIDTLVHTLMTVHRLAYESTDPIARFAMLCHDLGKALTPRDQWPSHHNHNMLGLKPLEELCKRLKVPNEYYSFAKIVVQYHSFAHHLYHHGAEGVVKLLDSLDAWRRPERVEPWILCCKCDFLGRKFFENRPFPRYEYFLMIFSICKQVTAKEFVEKGLKGTEIRDAVHQRRVELVTEFLQTLPESELDDSANSLPATVLLEKCDFTEEELIKMEEDLKCQKVNAKRFASKFGLTISDHKEEFVQCWKSFIPAECTPEYEAAAEAAAEAERLERECQKEEADASESA